MVEVVKTYCFTYDVNGKLVGIKPCYERWRVGTEYDWDLLELRDAK